MKQGKLKGLKVAILATDGAAGADRPAKRLDERGVTTEVVSPNEGRLRGWDHKEWGREVDVDQDLQSADPKDYDALVLPGGVMNPDNLRIHPNSHA